MDINYLTLTVVSDNIFILDMLGNYLFKNSSYSFYKRNFNDDLPNTDVYILIDDNINKIESTITKLIGKFIVVISHRTDRLFYERLLSLGVNCIYDYSSKLKLFDDFGLQMYIYYNGLSDNAIKKIIDDLEKQ